MELRTLRYFTEMARAGSMTKAAERLHITQPSLSRQLSELETELGKPLFERRSHGVVLTEEGQLLRERAEDILAMVDRTVEEFESLHDLAGGDLYIGCAESEGMSLLIRSIAKLRTRYPRLRFHFYSSGTDAIAERLDMGLLDLAVIVQPVDLAQYNYLTIPHQDTWGVLMRKDSPLAKKPSICIEDVLSLPLICSRQGLERDLLAWFGEKQRKLQIVATYDLLFNASLLVREGLGYAIGLEKIIYTGQDSALCFRPLEPAVPSPLHVIWKKYQILSAPTQYLLDQLREDLTGEKPADPYAVDEA